MNKNGWGLRVELLYILMFLFCLVIATIGLNRLGLLGENPDALIKPDTEEKEVYSSSFYNCLLNIYRPESIFDNLGKFDKEKFQRSLNITNFKLIICCYYNFHKITSTLSI